MMLVLCQVKGQEIIFLQDDKEIARIIRLEPDRCHGIPRIGIEALDSIIIHRVEAKKR